MSAPSTTEPSSPAAGKETVPAYSWYVVGLLTAVYALHTMDRGLLTIFMHPIQQEFALSDTKLGFLAGMAYAISFGLAGIPVGMLADRFNRRKLLSGLIAAWSLLTALVGLCTGYRSLVATRIGVGLAEAGAMPLALSVISDYLPQKRRSAGAGIFMSGTSIGTLGGLLLVGVLGAYFEWRTVFVIVGLPGVLLALLVFFTMREPVRGQMNPGGPPVKAKPAPLGLVAKYIASHSSLALLLSGTVIATAATAGIGNWVPSYLMRIHSLSLSEAAFAKATFMSAPGIVGALLGAYLTDRVGRRNMNWQPIFGAGAMVLATVGVVGMVMAPSLFLALGMLTVWTLGYTGYHAAGFGLTTTLAPISMRATTVAILAVLNNVIGYGAGTQLVAVLSDMLRERFGGDQLNSAIGVVGALYVLSAVLFLLAVQRLKAGLAEAEGNG